MDNPKTSKGQTLLRGILRNIIRGGMRENYRPDWLFGMELDFYFEEWGLAFEFQGDQHFAPVFGVDSHLAQAYRDVRKRRICADRGVCLVRVEARELHVKKIKYKIECHLHSKRKDLTKSQRKKWLSELFNPCRDRKIIQRIREDQVSYCRNIKERYGAVPSAHKRGSVAREKAIAQIWGNAIA